MSQKAGNLAHPGYRADIDGLRAIAVLSVIGYHAFPTLFKGGFVGVDIFFVISGYLISTIIFDSLRRDSFRFFEFYSRRVRRIFPALAAVLVASYLFGWFSLYAEEYKQLGKHVAGGAGFLSNFVLWSESGYFDNSAETKPLLHLWSLGIEEQFYIVWPFLLWLAWKRQINLLAIATTVGIISFAWNGFAVRTDAVAAFYSPHTRFWELMMGSVLAYTMRRGTGIPPSLRRLGLDSMLGNVVTASERNREALRNMQSVFGAALIVTGLLAITKDSPFPGWLALLPTLGAVLLISAGASAWLNRVVLSHPVLVWFGLISFPLYLWHWPLLSFARIVQGEEPAPVTRVAAVLASIVLGWLTYRLLETPIRTGAHGRPKTFTLLALMVVVGFVGHNCFDRNGLAFRIKSPDKHAASQGDGPVVRRKVIDCRLPLPKDSFCQQMAPETEPLTTVLIGDSHSGALFDGIVLSGNERFGRAINIGMGGCLPILGVEPHNECDKVFLAALKFIEKNPSIEYVTLSGYGQLIEQTSDDIRGKLHQGYREMIRRLILLKKKVIFVIDQPSLKESPKLCEDGRIELRNMFVRRKEFCAGVTGNDLVPRGKYDAFVERLRQSDSGAIFHDPTSIFCQGDGRCRIFDDGKRLYNDKHHLSAHGGRLVSQGLIRSLDEHKW